MTNNTSSNTFVIPGLQNKIALVTGISGGIGSAIAEELNRHGVTVVGIDKKQESDEKSIPISYVENMFSGDVRDESDIEQIVNSIKSKYARIDILINCAGIAEKTIGTSKQDTQSWQNVMDVNLRGTYICSKAVASLMIEQLCGTIINVSSVTGLTGFRASNGYGVSKAGVSMLTKTMATDLARHNIRVNAIAPGFIETQMTEDMQSLGKFSQDKLMYRIPMSRLGKPDEVAKPVAMLCSDWASYITGAVLTIDGGWTAFGGM